MEAKEGDTLLDVIRAAGLHIEAVCGGRGTCGMCKVRVNGEEGLACRIEAADGMRVDILARDDEHVILTEHSGDKTQGTSLSVCKTQGTSLSVCTAIAIDIGTTTVVVKALYTESGAEIAVRAFANPQRVYGADVLSRISNSMDDASLLSGIITSAIDKAIEDIINTEEIVPGKVVIAGNTTMTYLLLNLRCRSLGLAPFQPEFAIDETYKYSEVFGTETLSCPVFIYPYISAFVGGDIVSGLVNIEKHLEQGKDHSYILIDMGTNGELVYRKGDRLLTTSTAAGPALEGGNITCGMSGLPGAIYSAVYEGDGKFSCKTIGDKPALGICGSGVIDLMATLLDAGFVSETGAYAEPKDIVIADDIVFTQKDVREFQLAKGAIRAGIDILTEEIGEAPEMLYLAGGFGQNINLESAIRVGLIPGGLRGRIRFAGNTSLGGCVDACLESGPLPSLDIVAAAEEINLGSHRDFNNKFMETMLFE